ncbi:MAG TPA: response regulator transcription factor [Cyclobacteriaceae bacterium]|nr:response regulator transcription factor [Cyclobacteriaceae bacterium]
MKILVVEDEPKVAAFIKSGLEEQNCEVDVAYDGQIGERLALSNVYNIILLDIIMPMINGLELCKRIKQSKPNTPILMLTALGTTDDKVSGFESGADDYLVKPFEFKELMVRIKALTRRSYSNNDPGNRLKIADLELDMDKKVAIRGGKTIELTAKEYSLLEYFIRNKGRVVSRLDISEKVWDINFDTGTNVVDVYVNILRKKIDRDFANKLIHTRVGMGYILTEEE